MYILIREKMCKKEISKLWEAIEHIKDAIYVINTEENYEISLLIDAIDTILSEDP